MGSEQKNTKRTTRISNVPKTLDIMQSWLWYNESYKMFFSKRHTNNPQEYYCFFLDIVTNKRKHGTYRLTTDDMIVKFLGSEYRVKYLENMRRFDVLMIQLINIKNELDYMNWAGIPIPEEKGLPYTLPAAVPNNPLSY